MIANKQRLVFMTASIMAIITLLRSNSSMSCKHNTIFVDKCFVNFIQNELKLCFHKMFGLGKYSSFSNNNSYSNSMPKTPRFASFFKIISI